MICKKEPKICEKSQESTIITQGQAERLSNSVGPVMQQENEGCNKF